MSTTSIALASHQRGNVATVVTAGTLLGVVDGFCAFAINALFFSQPSAVRTFQGVAAAVLGKASFTLGARSALFGLAMHFAVAFTWVTLYVLLDRSSSALRRFTASWLGVAAAGAVLGAVIWFTMNFVVFRMTHLHPLQLTARSFVINLIQHILIVGPLIVATTRSSSQWPAHGATIRNHS